MNEWNECMNGMNRMNGMNEWMKGMKGMNGMNGMKGMNGMNECIEWMNAWMDVCMYGMMNNMNGIGMWKMSRFKLYLPLISMAIWVAYFL